MSQALAYEAMKALNFNNPAVVLSTIEAETNFRNVTGDSGRAVGYGQVWLKWHFSKLLKVADLLGVQLPSRKQPTTPAAEQLFINLILRNDKLSMYLAVEVIKGFWSGSGGDYVRFVKGYVGPSVPEKEIQRRLALYQKYGQTQTSPAPVSVPVSAGAGVNVQAVSVLVVTGLSVAALVGLISAAGGKIMEGGSEA